MLINFEFGSANMDAVPIRAKRPDALVTGLLVVGRGPLSADSAPLLEPGASGPSFLAGVESALTKPVTGLPEADMGLKLCELVVGLWPAAVVDGLCNEVPGRGT
eukprot:Colp12_sorted_trinity150504_noHs@13677